MKAKEGVCFVLLASLFFISSDAVGLYPFNTQTKAPQDSSSLIPLGGNEFKLFGESVTGFYTTNQGTIQFVEATGSSANARVLYLPVFTSL